MEKKIFRLPESSVVNKSYPELLPQISFIDRLFFTPLSMLWASLKKVCNWAFRALKCFLIVMGLLACYYITEYHRGWIDITILSDGDLKLMSGDLLKPEPVKPATKTKGK